MLTISPKWKAILSIGVCVILAVLTGLGTAAMFDVNDGIRFGKLFANEAQRVTGVLYSLLVLAVAFLAYLWYRRFSRTCGRVNVCTAIFSVVLSFFAMVGRCQDTTQGKLLFWPVDLLSKLLLLIGLSAFCYTLLHTLFRKLDNHAVPVSANRGESLSAWKLYGIAVLGIAIGWLPFIIVNYPGSVPFDTHRQLLEATGNRTLDASNPVMVTYLYGGLFSLGRLVNDNFGIFLCTVFQFLLLLAGATRSCVWGYRLSGSKAVFGATIAFFAAIPGWGAAVQCVLKDTVHTGFFLLFLVSYGKLFTEKETGVGNFISLFLFSVFVGLSRKAAVAIVVVCLLIWLIYRWKTERKILASVLVTLSAITLFATVNAVIYSLPNVIPPREQENYSLPFQQVARYCVEYESELTDEEIATIDAVLDYETILEKYDPNLSDPVKRTFHTTSDTAEMSAFWKLYLKFVQRHPMVFVDHILAGTYKYTYPLSPGNQPYRHYIQSDAAFYDASYVLPAAQKQLNTYFDSWERGFVTNLFIGPGFYTWMLLILVCYALTRKHYKALLILAPVIILFAGFYLSHLNGENRYAWPLMMAIPMCFVYVVYGTARNETFPAAEIVVTPVDTDTPGTSESAEDTMLPETKEESNAN